MKIKIYFISILNTVKKRFCYKWSHLAASGFKIGGSAENNFFRVAASGPKNNQHIFSYGQIFL